ncbi:MAG: RNA polymerase sigma factor [Isosphaeraceae bacterium]
METTNSLLDRLRESDDDAWRRFVAIYTPLIRGWLERRGLGSADADDVAQDVMAVVVRRVPEFQRERLGSFRAWLRAITANQIQSFWKRRRRRTPGVGGDAFVAIAEELADPASGMSRCWDDEYNGHLTRLLLEAVRPRFREGTWAAFQGLVLQGKPAEEVAGDLGMTVNAVQVAKSRVLSALRSEGEGLLDD